MQAKPRVTKAIRGSIARKPLLYKDYLRFKNDYYLAKFKYYRNKLKYLLLRGDFLQIRVLALKSRTNQILDCATWEKSKWRATFLSYECFQSRSTSITAVDCYRFKRKIIFYYQ